MTFAQNFIWLVWESCGTEVNNHFQRTEQSVRCEIEPFGGEAPRLKRLAGAVPRCSSRGERLMSVHVAGALPLSPAKLHISYGLNKVADALLRASDLSAYTSVKKKDSLWPSLPAQYLSCKPELPRTVALNATQSIKLCRLPRVQMSRPVAAGLCHADLGRYKLLYLQQMIASIVRRCSVYLKLAVAGYEGWNDVAVPLLTKLLAHWLLVKCCCDRLIKQATYQRLWKRWLCYCTWQNQYHVPFPLNLQYLC